jgi:hypothetical protein
MDSKISITTAIIALGITEFALRGVPTSASEFNSMFSKITSINSDGIAVESTTPSDFGTTWTAVKAKYDELVAAEPMVELRLERNKKLAESDWTQMVDSSLTDSVKAEWVTYRTALKDITDSATSLDDVTWPTKPS